MYSSDVARAAFRTQHGDVMPIVYPRGCEAPFDTVYKTYWETYRGENIPDIEEISDDEDAQHPLRAAHKRKIEEARDKGAEVLDRNIKQKNAESEAASQVYLDSLQGSRDMRRALKAQQQYDNNPQLRVFPERASASASSSSQGPAVPSMLASLGPSFLQREGLAASSSHSEEPQPPASAPTVARHEVPTPPLTPLVAHPTPFGSPLAAARAALAAAPRPGLPPAAVAKAAPGPPVPPARFFRNLVGTPHDGPIDLE